MSEVRFTCGACAQLLACDDAWCGNAVACPGCGQRIEVPHFLAFREGAPGQSPVAQSTATPRAPRAPLARTDAYAKVSGIYTESAWDRHTEEVTGEKVLPGWLLWVLLLAPFPLAIFLLQQFRGPGAVLTVFVLCALVSGWALARRKGQRVVESLVVGVVSAIGMFFVYGLLGLGILLAGCMLL